VICSKLTAWFDDEIKKRNTKPDNRGWYHFNILRSNYYRNAGKDTRYFRIILKKYYDYGVRLHGKEVEVIKYN